MGWCSRAATRVARRGAPLSCQPIEKLHNNPVHRRRAVGRTLTFNLERKDHMGQAFGVVGLEVMGRNIAQNIERNGFPVAVYNRTVAKTEDFMKGPATGKKFHGAKDLKDFVSSLEKPRRILMLVKAGGPTDSTIDSIKGLLEPGDILIDGGNALYTDTERRAKALEPTGIKFFGMGVSGGEEGALWGPSLMPGGDKASYERLKPVLEKVAAKPPQDRAPSVTYCGAGGA